MKIKTLQNLATPKIMTVYIWYLQASFYQVISILFLDGQCAVTFGENTT